VGIETFRAGRRRVWLFWSIRPIRISIRGSQPGFEFAGFDQPNNLLEIAFAGKRKRIFF